MKFTDDELKQLKEAAKMRGGIVSFEDVRPLIQRLEAAELVAEGAEMAWVVMANVSGGNWKDQPKDWQEAAARWRDAYHKDWDVWRKIRK